MEQKRIIKMVAVCLLVIMCGFFYFVLSEKEESLEVVTDHFAKDSLTEGMENSASGDLAGKDSGAECGEDKKNSDIYIHICGEVKKPGVYTFESEPRVIEVVKKAGGFTKKADESVINLAETVSDGAKIEIEAKVKKKAATERSQTDSTRTDLVNINTADKAQLMTIPGIGEAKAVQIISYRESNGKFQKIEEIMNISGIKQGIFSKIKDFITVS